MLSREAWLPNGYKDIHTCCGEAQLKNLYRLSAFSIELVAK